MKSIKVNQTGEVKLLSQLLNQKVDTVYCGCSRGKTLTVQGLWVGKKSRSLVEMHLQAPELLTFRYAYKTLLNQSKQKGKKGWSSAVQMDAHIHTFIHSFTIHVESIPATLTLLFNPLCLLEREEQSKNTKRGASGPAHIFYLTFTWSSSSSRLFFGRFLTQMKHTGPVWAEWTLVQLTCSREAAGKTTESAEEQFKCLVSKEKLKGKLHRNSFLQHQFVRCSKTLPVESDQCWVWKSLGY